MVAAEGSARLSAGSAGVGGVVGRYRIVEDLALADCALDIRAADLGDLFDTAASALASLMVDPETLRITEERTLRLEAAALDLLFFDWLSELIALKDRDRMIFPATRAAIAGAGPFSLEAVASGGTIEAGSTALRADPKAVTFHQFVVEEAGGEWHARVVIDI